MPERIRVTLCDDHAMVRAGLRRILADDADIEVVAEAGSAEEALAVAWAQRPEGRSSALAGGRAVR